LPFFVIKCHLDHFEFRVLAIDHLT
jgi:hypothetical protein